VLRAARLRERASHNDNRGPIADAV